MSRCVRCKIGCRGGKPWRARSRCVDSGELRPLLAGVAALGVELALAGAAQDRRRVAHPVGQVADVPAEAEQVAREDALAECDDLDPHQTTTS
jgi:hypothetical protein